MANKSLSLKDIDLMRSMVVNGIAPEDIAKHFNVAISSVHNYKARFKAEGVNFPSVRGKRPTGSVEVKSSKNTIGEVSLPTDTQSIDEKGYKFIVNGTTVQISGHAKNINIGKNGMEISF